MTSKKSTLDYDNKNAINNPPPSSNTTPPLLSEQLKKIVEDEKAAEAERTAKKHAAAQQDAARRSNATTTTAVTTTTTSMRSSAAGTITTTNTNQRRNDNDDDEDEIIVSNNAVVLATNNATNINADIEQDNNNHNNNNNNKNNGDDDNDREPLVKKQQQPGVISLNADVRGRRSDLGSQRMSGVIPVGAASRQGFGFYFPRRLVPLLMVALALFLESFFDGIIGISVAANAQRAAWSDGDVSLVGESFVWGYAVSCILGGVLSHRFGFKPIIGIGVVVNALLTMLTPFIITSFVGLMILRCLCGASEGVVLPATYTLMRYATLFIHSSSSLILFFYIRMLQ